MQMTAHHAWAATSHDSKVNCNTLFLLIFYIAVAACLAAPLNAQAQIARVLETRGTALVVRTGQIPRLLGPGERLDERDVINVARDSWALLEFNDQTRVTLRPNTVFRLDHYKADAPEALLLGLVRGGMRALSGFLSQRNPSDVKFHTSLVTIGIRGTEFDARLCEADCAAEERASPTPWQLLKPVARVVEMNGISAAGLAGQAARLLVPGAGLFEGEGIATGPASYVVLAFRDGSRVTLAARSKLVIVHFRFDETARTGRAVLVHPEGTADVHTGAIAKRGPTYYSFVTPMGEIRPRGTGFKSFVNTVVNTATNTGDQAKNNIDEAKQKAEEEAAAAKKIADELVAAAQKAEADAAEAVRVAEQKLVAAEKIKQELEAKVKADLQKNAQQGQQAEQQMVQKTEQITGILSNIGKKIDDAGDAVIQNTAGLSGPGGGPSVAGTVITTVTTAGNEAKQKAEEEAAAAKKIADELVAAAQKAEADAAEAVNVGAQTVVNRTEQTEGTLRNIGQKIDDAGDAVIRNTAGLSGPGDGPSVAGTVITTVTTAGNEAKQKAEEDAAAAKKIADELVAAAQKAEADAAEAVKVAEQKLVAAEKIKQELEAKVKADLQQNAQQGQQAAQQVVATVVSGAQNLGNAAAEQAVAALNKAADPVMQELTTLIAQLRNNPPSTQAEAQKLTDRAIALSNQMNTLLNQAQAAAGAAAQSDQFRAAAGMLRAQQIAGFGVLESVFVTPDLVAGGVALMSARGGLIDLIRSSPELLAQVGLVGLSDADLLAIRNLPGSSAALRVEQEVGSHLASQGSSAARAFFAEVRTTAGVAMKQAEAAAVATAQKAVEDAAAAKKLAEEKVAAAAKAKQELEAKVKADLQANAETGKQVVQRQPNRVSGPRSIEELKELVDKNVANPTIRLGPVHKVPVPRPIPVQFPVAEAKQAADKIVDDVKKAAEQTGSDGKKLIDDLVVKAKEVATSATSPPPDDPRVPEMIAAVTRLIESVQNLPADKIEADKVLARARTDLLQIIARLAEINPPVPQLNPELQSALAEALATQILADLTGGQQQAASAFNAAGQHIAGLAGNVRDGALAGAVAGYEDGRVRGERIGNWGLWAVIGTMGPQGGHYPAMGAIIGGIVGALAGAAAGGLEGAADNVAGAGAAGARAGGAAGAGAAGGAISLDASVYMEPPVFPSLSPLPNPRVVAIGLATQKEVADALRGSSTASSPPGSGETPASSAQNESSVLVWDGSVELVRNGKITAAGTGGMLHVDANQQVVLGKVAGVSGSGAPRPDLVKVDPGLFGAGKSVDPGLYVWVRDGAVQLEKDGKVVDVAAGNAAVATSERIALLDAVPNFMRFDKTPRPFPAIGDTQIDAFRISDGAILHMCNVR